jgi:hypothetical protein
MVAAQGLNVIGVDRDSDDLCAMLPISGASLFPLSST